MSDGPLDPTPAPAAPPTPAPASGSVTDRERHRNDFGWVGGVVLIALGVVFMAQQYGLVTGNWWAIFIYLAAFANFANMVRSWRKDGRFGSAATGSLVGGLLLTTIASIFMFNLRWDIWWPAVLITIGIGIVAGSLLGRR